MPTPGVQRYAAQGLLATLVMRVPDGPGARDRGKPDASDRA